MVLVARRRGAAAATVFAALAGVAVTAGVAASAVGVVVAALVAADLVVAFLAAAIVVLLEEFSRVLRDVRGWVVRLETGRTVVCRGGSRSPSAATCC